jgi:hypothetical protein
VELETTGLAQFQVGPLADIRCPRAVPPWRRRCQIEIQLSCYEMRLEYVENKEGNLLCSSIVS